MRWLITLLVILLVGLQYRLWYGEDSYSERAQLQVQVKEQRRHNAVLRAKNEVLARDVSALKTGMAGVEEHARTDLGMIGQDETFYMILGGDKTEGGRADTLAEHLE